MQRHRRLADDDFSYDGERLAITHLFLQQHDDGASVTAGDVTVTVASDDEPGVMISETPLRVDEGDSSTYTVKLDSAPAPQVTEVTLTAPLQLSLRTGAPPL